MCRLLVFKGTEPIQISHLVTKPAHSIINQAFDARLRLDATRSVNGDGFGVGWYDAAMAPEYDYNTHPYAPCIFTSVTPAWNNANLHRLADKIQSPLIFAHVRASTAGALSETNCHPWRYGRLMWMHNGQISSFSRVKRRLLAALPEELFLYPQGHTDSELAFCVFLSHLRDPLRCGTFAWRELREAMLATIADFNAWAKEAGVQEPSLMNFVVSDGESVVCTRYVSSRTEEAASLYFSSGTSFYEDKEESSADTSSDPDGLSAATTEVKNVPGLPPPRGPGRYRMVKADKREKIIVVASEPLTFEKADWIQIPTNTLVAITPRMNVLQQPIEDEFATVKGDQDGATKRNTEFAIKAGY
ncbi:N-terminal nucleophile aminohydrolase, partial [Tilletiaria anomala UBC 951]